MQIYEGINRIVNEKLREMGFEHFTEGDNTVLRIPADVPVSQEVLDKLSSSGVDRVSDQNHVDQTTFILRGTVIPMKYVDIERFEFHPGQILNEVVPVIGQLQGEARVKDEITKIFGDFSSAFIVHMEQIDGEQKSRLLVLL